MPRSIRARLVHPSSHAASASLPGAKSPRTPRSDTLAARAHHAESTEPGSPTLFAGETGVVFIDLDGHAALYENLIAAERPVVEFLRPAPESRPPRRSLRRVRADLVRQRPRSEKPERRNSRGTNVRASRALVQPSRGHL